MSEGNMLAIRKLGLLSQGFDNGRTILHLDAERGNLKGSGTYHWYSPIIGKRSIESKVANNRIRTLLLSSLCEAYGLDKGMKKCQGQLVFTDKQMDMLEKQLGKDVFRRGDFGINAKGEVASGRPLTVRRLKAITEKVNRGVSCPQPDKTVASAPRAGVDADHEIQLYPKDEPLDHPVAGELLTLRNNSGKNSNCFFYSVLHQLNRNDEGMVTREQARWLRNNLADHLSQNKNRIHNLDFALTDALEQLEGHTTIRDEGVSASVAWCPVLADLMKRPVILYSERQGEKTRAEYNTDFNGQPLAGEPIVLYFAGEIDKIGHYQSVTGVRPDPDAGRKFESRLGECFKGLDLDIQSESLSEVARMVINENSPGDGDGSLRTAFERAENWCLRHSEDDEVFNKLNEIGNLIRNNLSNGVFKGFKNAEETGKFASAYMALIRQAYQRDRDVSEGLNRTVPAGCKFGRALRGDRSVVLTVAASAKPEPVGIEKCLERTLKIFENFRRKLQPGGSIIFADEKSLLSNACKEYIDNELVVRVDELLHARESQGAGAAAPDALNDFAVAALGMVEKVHDVQNIRDHGSLRFDENLLTEAIIAFANEIGEALK